MNPKFSLRPIIPPSVGGIVYTATAFEVVGPEGVCYRVEVSEEVPGWEARRLAQSICNTRNGGGKCYELQRWCAAMPGFEARWHTEVLYFNADEAIAERNRRNEKEPGQHQVVAVLRIIQ